MTDQPRKPVEPFGIYPKYMVIKVEDGQRVDDAFVLRPEHDKHARVALAAYARSIKEDNPTLAEDQNKWLVRIFKQGAQGDGFFPDQLPDGDYIFRNDTVIVQNGRLIGFRLSDGTPYMVNLPPVFNSSEPPEIKSDEPSLS